MTQTALPGLVTPPRLPKNTLRIVPLGGIGEIGRNMTVFEIEGKLLIVDCGVLFPEETQPGVDLILPDFSYIENRLQDIVAVVLTHGHEDHIGAVPYLLRLRADIPIVGSQLTLALIEAKLQEHRIKPNTMIVVEGQVEKFGPFECEFVAVNHSIPDALAVFLRTAGGTVLHTGDFKMDQLPLDGRITDLRHFAKLGEEGVDLFMSDSTNADVPGFTTAEKEIGPTLDRMFGQASKRIIVASFSSHVHRVQQVLDAAAKHGRNVAFVGRSMVRNMAVFEIDGKLLIVDCGVLFPEETQPGVDLILPDFSYIEDRLDDVVAVILTHGHEDHIGAVPYLLKRRSDIPLVGSQLTLALIEAKLQEHRIRPYTLTVEEGQVEKFGPFECEFVAVNHSIPDALAVFLRTAGGTVLHTGDFKMDQLPLDGRITDLRHFAKLGEEGVDLFMSDSTNADVPGFTTAEKEIGPTLERLFGQATKRIIVASFSSHVHRVQQVLDAAAKHNRKVAFVGRSMVRNMAIAEKLGYLDVPAGLIVDIKNIDNLPDNRVVLMSTGSQGEPMAALSRMANGDHRVVVGDGDTVILASSLIPGNENAVFRIINGLLKLGADVIHKGNAKVHVSGHAAAGELLYCYNILEPLNAMPVHGETRHLIANGKIAIESGVPEASVILADNGTVIDLRDHQADIVGQVEVGFVYVDGSSVGEITDADLKDRRILGDEGFISIITVIHRATGKVVSGPEIHARGVAEDDSVFDDIIPKINAALEEAVQNHADHTSHQLQQVVRRVVGTWVNRKLRRKPMIIPVVLEA